MAWRTLGFPIQATLYCKYKYIEFLKYNGRLAKPTVQRFQPFFFIPNSEPQRLHMCRTYICPRALEPKYLLHKTLSSQTPKSRYGYIHQRSSLKLKAITHHSPHPPPSHFQSHQDKLFGFLVPYFDRDVIRLPTPSYI